MNREIRNMLKKHDREAFVERRNTIAQEYMTELGVSLEDALDDARRIAVAERERMVF